MKILHVINTLDHGGAQSVLRDLIEGWHSDQDDHLVISLASKGQLSGFLSTRGIHVTHLDMMPGRFSPAAFFKMMKFIRAYRPDIIQTWLYHSDLLGTLATKLVSKTPVVWGVHHTTHSVDSVKPSTWRVIRILRFLARIMPARIICCSDSAYHSHLALGYPISKMVTIYNGVDTQLFLPDEQAGPMLRQELGIPSDARLIGMFARYNPQKDHRTFIQAAAILANGFPDVHFVLAGAQVDHSNIDLMTQIQQNDLQARVHLLGRREDMPFLNAAVDIVSLSSAYGEALPLTLCEGMSCGTPCVATDIGDSRKIIGDTGLIVKPENPAELAQAWQEILDLTDEEYKHLSGQARARIIEHYSLSKMVDQYKRVYTETINRA